MVTERTELYQAALLMLTDPNGASAQAEQLLMSIASEEQR
jgi:hypothetical protein